LGASRSREQQAQLRIKSFESERRTGEAKSDATVLRGSRSALAAVSRYQFLSQSVTQAERNVQASIARYRSGEASIIEVTDYRVHSPRSALALYQAMFDYQQAAGAFGSADRKVEFETKRSKMQKDLKTIDGEAYTAHTWKERFAMMRQKRTWPILAVLLAL
jgi:hypothetical protein